MKIRYLAYSLLLASCATTPLTVGKDCELLIYPKVANKTQAVLDAAPLIASMDIVPNVEVSPGVFSPISAITGEPTIPGSADVLHLSKASPSLNLTQPFVFQKIRSGKKYRIYGYAYNEANAKMSLDNASYVDVTVGNNNTPPMAVLPIYAMHPTPFAATTALTINASGRFDTIKATLFLVSGNSQVAISETSRRTPVVEFSNLQGNTSYRLAIEVYRFGAMVFGTDYYFTTTTDTEPATASFDVSVPGIASTIAGDGQLALMDGAAATASFNQPSGIARDAQGNLYIADTDNHAIRKLTPDGIVSTLFGGTSGYEDGPTASFSYPVDVALDSSGNLYVSDKGNGAIRKVSPEGVVSTLAGNSLSGFTDGEGTSAQFFCPEGIALDSAGNLYVADSNNHAIRKISPSGTVMTVAGNGTLGYRDGNASEAQFSYPTGVAVDHSDNIYVADQINNRIRKITPAGEVSTYAGKTQLLPGEATQSIILGEIRNPCRLAFDQDDNLFFSNDEGIQMISKDGVISRLTRGGSGYEDGALSAKFSQPAGLSVDRLGNIYVADRYNSRIRKVQ